MVPAADAIGDRGRLERVAQLEYLADLLFPQRHYQYAQQSTHQKTRLAVEYTAEPAPDPGKCQPDLSQGVPRKDRSPDRRVRRRTRNAAQRTDGRSERYRETDHTLQTRLFLAAGRTG